MKNFKVNALADNAKKALTRAEMKNVVGGDNCGNGAPGDSCSAGWQCQSGVCEFGLCTSIGENCFGNGPCPPWELCLMGPYGPYCVQ